MSVPDAFGSCPECGADWKYHADDGTGPFSRLIGRVWNDRVQEWQCPFCSATWDRWSGVLIGAGVLPSDSAAVNG